MSFYDLKTPPDFTALDRQVAEELRISKAKINRNRSWYKMMTRSAGKMWDVCRDELKKESDQTLMIAYENMHNLEPLNAWFFLLKTREAIRAVIHQELSDRGYENVYGADHRPTAQWAKRRSR